LSQLRCESLTILTSKVSHTRTGRVEREIEAAQETGTGSVQVGGGGYSPTPRKNLDSSKPNSQTNCTDHSLARSHTSLPACLPVCFAAGCNPGGNKTIVLVNVHYITHGRPHAFANTNFTRHTSPYHDRYCYYYYHLSQSPSYLYIEHYSTYPCHPFLGTTPVLCHAHLPPLLLFRSCLRRIISSFILHM
jgi:hypothetical protein